MGRGVDELPGGAVEDAFELLDLATLDVRERRLDPARRLGLLALDPANEVALSRAQPLGDLVQRAATLRRVRLELCGGGRRSLLRRLGPGPRGAGPRRPAAPRPPSSAARCRCRAAPRAPRSATAPARRSARGGRRAAAALDRGPGARPRAAARPVPAPSQNASASPCRRRCSLSANALRRVSARRRSSSAYAESESARPRASARSSSAERSRSSLLHDGVDLGLRPFDLALDCSAVRQAAAKRERADDRSEAGQKTRRRDRELDLRIARRTRPRRQLRPLPLTPAAARRSRVVLPGRARRRQAPPPPAGRRRRTRSRMQSRVVTQAS